jgi:hypothetical protein
MKSFRAASLAATILALSTAPALAEPLLVGVFAGALPCADCSGLQTELTLVRKASGWAEGRYLLKQTYLGRPVKSVITTGDWTTLRGDAVDDNAVVYELDPDSPNRAQHFRKEGEGRVRVLDKDLKAPPAGVRSTLARQTRDLPTAAAIDCLRKGGIQQGPACAKAR